MILLDGQVPVKYGLRLNSECKYIDFKKDLSKLCNLDAALMLVCELSNSQIRCILSDDQKLKVSTATELFVYEIPKSDFFRQRNSTEIGISIENGLKDIQRNKGKMIIFILVLSFLASLLYNELLVSSIFFLILHYFFLFLFRLVLF